MNASAAAPLDPAAEAGIADVAPQQSLGRDIWLRFRRNWMAMMGVAFVSILILAAIFAPLITKYSPITPNLKARKLPPFSGDHYFGTDRLGRDVFAQIVYGARISLKVGLLVAFSAALIGTIIGAVSGFVGGRVDGFVMRIVDIFLSVPYIILTVALVGIIGDGVGAVIIALALTGWFIDARVVRSSFLQLKEQEFVQAAKALGYSNARIIFRHILPNALQPVIVYTTLGIGASILGESALSFLAIGIKPPEPSWGLLVATNKGLMDTMPHLVFFPGAAIFLTVLSFTVIGDGLRDALDPRLKSR